MASSVADPGEGAAPQPGPSQPDSSPTDPLPGQVIGPVRVGPIAHGGHWVARWQQRVIFLRHALEGELVEVRLTATGARSYWRGEVSAVLEAAPQRVLPPCPVAGRCGGCDFQHVERGHQLELKRQVVAEQLHRLAGIDWPGAVQALPGDAEGLAYRTRMRYLVEAGQVGLRAYRSHDLVPLPAQGCLIADPRTPDRRALADLAAGLDHGEIVTAASPEQVSVLLDGRLVSGPAVLTEQVLGRRLQVRAEGFWQVHPAAARVLSEQVLNILDPRPGEWALDLYCGVGLFAGALLAAGARVTGVESDRRAVGLARRNVPGARFLAGRTEQVLPGLPGRGGVIVLDPPRTGAGRAVVQAVTARRPRSVCLISCDPASMARDVALFAAHGYRLAGLHAFDLFPMTQHVECVSELLPA